MDRAQAVAVIGSRNFHDEPYLFHILDQFCIRQIVSGGARGADTMAKRYAVQRGIAMIELRPDWRRYGRGAGLRCNQDVVEAAECVIAFWDGRSRGTGHAISLARAVGKPVYVFWPADSEA